MQGEWAGQKNNKQTNKTWDRSTYKGVVTTEMTKSKKKKKKGLVESKIGQVSKRLLVLE